MSEEPIARLIRIHLARYPEMGIADVYKLLYQACFGPGHLIPSRKKAQEWLELEAGQQTANAGEPLVESVHPEGAIVRLHLRPYLAHTGDLKALLAAFVRSAEQVQGSPQTMARWWGVFEGLCGAGQDCGERFAAREVRLFGSARAAEEWPAVHHSPPYLNAYHPVYRVLTRGEAEALCQRLRIPLAAI